MTNLFKLVPGKLSLDELRTVTTNKDMIYLDESADALIRQSTALVDKVIEDNKTVYGINTGFGSLANQIISKENLKQLQRNIVLSHACGTGDLLSDDVVSLILLLKINSLAQGFSGIRKEIIDALTLFYNKKMYPCIPAKGSV
ncbi:MAG: aromatic amino acid lyase, partial [Proteobacteria bacterium]|nr:aromatic amino acid lyase [Pseudomonadota bacterium]